MRLEAVKLHGKGHQAAQKRAVFGEVIWMETIVWIWCGWNADRIWAITRKTAPTVMRKNGSKDFRRKLTSIQGTHLLDDLRQFGNDCIDLGFGRVSTQGKPNGALC